MRQCSRLGAAGRAFPRPARLAGDEVKRPTAASIRESLQPEASGRRLERLGQSAGARGRLTVREHLDPGRARDTLGPVARTRARARIVRPPVEHRPFGVWAARALKVFPHVEEAGLARGGRASLARGAERWFESAQAGATGARKNDRRRIRRSRRRRTTSAQQRRWQELAVHCEGPVVRARAARDGAGRAALEAGRAARSYAVWVPEVVPDRGGTTREIFRGSAGATLTGRALGSKNGSRGKRGQTVRGTCGDVIGGIAHHQLSWTRPVEGSGGHAESRAIRRADQSAGNLARQRIGSRAFIH